MASIITTLTITDDTTGIRDSVSKTTTTTGDDVQYLVQEVGTSEAEITIAAGIGDVGLCKILNLDATNYVQVGFATGAYYLRILPGQFALIPLEPAQASIFAKANTAACNVSFYFHEA
mgnify:CR=1 FL=1